MTGGDQSRSATTAVRGTTEVHQPEIDVRRHAGATGRQRADQGIRTSQGFRSGTNIDPRGLRNELRSSSRDSTLSRLRASLRPALARVSSQRGELQHAELCCAQTCRSHDHGERRVGKRTDRDEEPTSARTCLRTGTEEPQRSVTAVHNLPT